MTEASLSIVVPIFNGASVMEGAITSVLRQQFTRWELLLVDDGSTDASPRLAAEWSRRDPRIRLIPNPTNQGIARTYNQGIREARAPLVVVLHQDCSLVGDDWLDRAMRSFDGPECLAVVASPMHDVAEMTSVEKLFWIIRNHVATTDPLDPADSGERLFSENKADLFRKDLLLRVGGFDESVAGGGEDQVLAVRLREQGLHVREPNDLLFRASLGTDRSLGQNLRKEHNYGRQMRTVLLRTGFRNVRRTGQGLIDRWLLNRLSIICWVTWTVTFLLVGALSGRPWIALLATAGPLFRVVQVWVRAVRARRSYRLTLPDVAWSGPLALVSDLAYLTGLVTPSWNRAKRSPT